MLCRCSCSCFRCCGTCNKVGLTNCRAIANVRCCCSLSDTPAALACRAIPHCLQPADSRFTAAAASFASHLLLLTGNVCLCLLLVGLCPAQLLSSIHEV